MGKKLPSVAELREELRLKKYTTFMGKVIGYKGSHYRPFLSHVFIEYYLRFFSAYFTKLSLWIGASANQVTFLTIIMGIIAAVLFGFNNYWYSIIACIIIQLIHILDCTDGELARYNKTSSLSGDYLDILQHWITETLVFLFMGYGLFKIYPYPEIIVLGGLIAISFLLRECYLMSSTFIYVELKVMNIKDELSAKRLAQKSKEATGLFKFLQKINSSIDFFFSFNGMSVIFFIFAIFNQLIIPFIFYGIFLPITVASGLYYEFYKGYERGYSRFEQIKKKI